MQSAAGAAIRDGVRGARPGGPRRAPHRRVEVLDGNIAGIVVHTGARVAALAGAGEVLVSSTVKDLVAGSGIEFADRGAHQLKGLPGEVQILAVVST